MKPKKKQVTIQDVARECGTTKAVVSAVLRGTKSSVRYSEQTRLKVISAVRQMGYRPSRASRQVNRQGEGAIGLLVRDHYNVSFKAYVGLYSAMARTDALLVVEQLKDKDQLPLMIAERAVDGILIFEDPGPTVLGWFDEYRIPYVAVNALLETAPYRVEMDEAAVIRMMLDLFAKAGRKNCAWVFYGDAPYNTYRRDLLISGCREKSWPEPRLLDIHYKDGVYDRHQVLSLFRDNPQLDAVILQRDQIAPVICDVLAELGKTVPEDVSIIGMHNNSADPYMQPPLDAVVGRLDLAAEMAVELLMKIIDGQDVEKSQLLAQYDYHQRGSMFCIPQ